MSIKKEKKNKTAIIIILILLFLFLCGFGFYKYIMVPFKECNLNYNELTEDIESIKKDGKIINAQLIESEKEVNPSYQGDGYIITELPGGECIDYVIYHNGKVIWEYTIIIPLENKNN